MSKSKPSTWAERLQRTKTSVVKPVPINIAGMKTGQIMYVPSALDVDAFIRRIPRGQSMSTSTLRERMAREQKAEVTCPITTGFHLKTVAEAAFEAHNAGAALGKITPFWRVIGSDCPTFKKLSFDTTFVLRMRALEGLPS
jgi:hypothetical protein